MIDSLSILSIHKSYRGATNCAVVVTSDLRVGLLFLALQTEYLLHALDIACG
jgi:hypothetical protein